MADVRCWYSDYSTQQREEASGVKPLVVLIYPSRHDNTGRGQGKKAVTCNCDVPINESLVHDTSNDRVYRY